jgi:hypothetical protein
MTRSKLIYIAGDGRSGSTLLDLVLGSHPSITGTGEVHRLSLHPEERLCGCGATYDGCPYWTSIRESLAKRIDAANLSSWASFPLHVPPAKIEAEIFPNLVELLLVLNAYRPLRTASSVSHHAKRLLDTTKNAWSLFDSIAAHDVCEYVVDSTKTPVRLKSLYSARPDSIHVIYLVRDGRAVAASARRRTGQPIDTAARAWLRNNRNVLLMLAGIPKQQIHMVRYEDFCRNPDSTIRETCGFLGLEYHPSMLDFRATENHQIPGNPMLHDEENDTIRLDERWKNELSDVELEQFRSASFGLAGVLNRALGYTAGRR